MPLASPPPTCTLPVWKAKLFPAAAEGALSHPSYPRLAAVPQLPGRTLKTAGRNGGGVGAGPSCSALGGTKEGSDMKELGPRGRLAEETPWRWPPCLLCTCGLQELLPLSVE